MREREGGEEAAAEEREWSGGERLRSFEKNGDCFHGGRGERKMVGREEVE